MAKKKPQRRSRKSKSVIPGLVFTKENYIIFFVGLFLILLGYVLMAMGGKNDPLSLTVSPVILFVAYFLVVPAAIIYSKKLSRKSGDNENDSGQ